mgnify:CR=1 FL=1
MKTEIREVMVPKKWKVYIADDDTEFATQRECEEYEFKQEVNKRKLSWRACTAIEDDFPAKLWYIHSEEEFKWLKKTEWVHTYVDGEFSNEGWYIAIFHDGGDYRDEHEVYRLDNYIDYYQQKIQEIIDLTKP